VLSGGYAQKWDPQKGARCEGLTARAARAAVEALETQRASLRVLRRPKLRREPAEARKSAGCPTAFWGALRRDAPA